MENSYGAQEEVIKDLRSFGWFKRPGAYVLVDGQFGSTGKGVLASVLAEVGQARISLVTTNAGPNSGHTGISPVNGEKIVTRQIPVAAVMLNHLSYLTPTYLNAGAIIDPEVLNHEVMAFSIHPLNVRVHPCAAVIFEEDRQREVTGGPSFIASTGKGVGSALARKIMREGNVMKLFLPASNNWFVKDWVWDWSIDVVLVETAQGFSLGINDHRFYPHTTSRECTVMQAIADARIPTSRVQKVAACYRTFPIRVGNTNKGSSGDGYPDQMETTWKNIGVEPEYTTVTRRERRVFDWSDLQFRESVATNEPDLLFINFMNYLPPEGREPFLRNVLMQYKDVMDRRPQTILAGYGPSNADVALYDY